MHRRWRTHPRKLPKQERAKATVEEWWQADAMVKSTTAKDTGTNPP